MSERPSIVFIDLDGPILDVRQRYFAAHLRAADGLEAASLTSQAYWAAKRDRRAIHDILGVPEESQQSKHYGERWLSVIESPELLRLDALHATARGALARFAAVPVRILATMRSNAEGAQETLERLDLVRYFTSIELIPHRAGSKEAIFRTHGNAGAPATVAVIGDTEMDITPARALGFRTVAVTCGIRSPEYLATLGATALVDSLSGAADLLLRDASEESEARTRARNS